MISDGYQPTVTQRFPGPGNETPEQGTQPHETPGGIKKSENFTKMLKIYLKKAVEVYFITDYYKLSIQVLLIMIIGLVDHGDFLRTGYIFRLYMVSQVLFLVYFMQAFIQRISDEIQIGGVIYVGIMVGVVYSDLVLDLLQLKVYYDSGFNFYFFALLVALILERLISFKYNVMEQRLWKVSYKIEYVIIFFLTFTYLDNIILAILSVISDSKDLKNQIKGEVNPPRACADP